VRERGKKEEEEEPVSVNIFFTFLSSLLFAQALFA
jgi:hypothetical protein